ncbi:MAG: glycosyltransferase family 2 protein [Anaerolineae bacterium]|nr:glycosyltransferase family 2 protein [Anaerolineae bacterium]
MLDLAVIIVTWNVREIVLDALRTLYTDLENSGLSAKVIVVDSASDDDTVGAVRQNFPQVEVIASQENLGFGRSNNAGMEALGFGKDVPPEELPSAVYLLNPDTLTQPGATRQLYDTLFSATDIGLTGAQLSYGDGSFQHSAFAFPGLRQLWAEFFPTPGRFIEGRFNGRYPRALYAGKTAFDVDFMLGATMMLRREVILEMGMFDPQFFMYGEEVDWQWRIRKAGWRIVCDPRAHVIHLVGQSTGQAKPRSIRNLWQSRLILYKKHYPAWKLTVAKWLVSAGMRRKIQQAQAEHAPDDVIQAYQTVQEWAQV